jgi:hypothetical protein
MSDTPGSNEAPPLPPKPPLDKTNLVFAAIGLAAIIAVLVASIVTAPDGDGKKRKKHKRGTQVTSVGPDVGDDGDAAQQPPVIPADDARESIVVSETGTPSVWIDIDNPAALRSALQENAWLAKAVSAPLGTGFLGGWAAFLGSKSDDLGLAQQLANAPSALMKDVLADVLLSQPARITFFTGPGGHAPAFIVPNPSAAMTTTIDAMMGALARGGFTVEACPGAPAPPPRAPPVRDDDGNLVDAGPPVPPPPNPNRFEVVRWRVADHVVYAANARGRFALSQSQASVFDAVCAPAPTLGGAGASGASASGTNGAVRKADVRVSFDTEKSGREAQALAAFLGGSTQPSFELALDGTRLVPIGIRASLASPDRLVAEPVPAESWKAVPEDMPVFLAAGIALPKELTTESLASFWQKPNAKTATKPRHVVLVWQPHGDDVDTEVGVIWSDTGDEFALREAFAGKNAMQLEVACKRVLIASTQALLSRMKSACSGKSPSVMFAKPDVVAALQQPMSIGVVIDAGRALGTLLSEGWSSDEGHDKKKEPPEITDAKKLLLELPRFGLFGTRNANALEPRGFSS